MTLSLVVGGTGSIGKKLVHRLIAVDHDIYYISKSATLNSLSKSSRICIDLTKENQLDILNSFEFEYVFNTVGYINPDLEIENDWDIITNHLLTTRNLIKSLNWKRIRNFIHLGSGKEYSNYSGTITEEGENEPLTPYGLSKLFATKYAIMRAKLDNLPINVIRVFNTFGPDIKTGVIPYIIHKALKNQNIELSSPLKEIDFIYIDDLIDGIVKSMDLPTSGEIYNIGSGIGQNLETMANMIVDQCKSGKIIWGNTETRRGDPMNMIAEISKFTNAINWYPRISFEHGLLITIEDSRKSMKTTH